MPAWRSCNGGGCGPHHGGSLRRNVQRRSLRHQVPANTSTPRPSSSRVVPRRSASARPQMARGWRERRSDTDTPVENRRSPTVSGSGVQFLDAVCRQVEVPQKRTKHAHRDPTPTIRTQISPSLRRNFLRCDLYDLDEPFGGRRKVSVVAIQHADTACDAEVLYADF